MAASKCRSRVLLMVGRKKKTSVMFSTRNADENCLLGICVYMQSLSVGLGFMLELSARAIFAVCLSTDRQVHMARFEHNQYVPNRIILNKWSDRPTHEATIAFRRNYRCCDL